MKLGKGRNTNWFGYNKNGFYTVVCLLAATVVLTACERDIEFKLIEESPKLVVEATIENDQAPVVVLTNSLNYFSSVSPDLLLNSFVHNADVFISNGSLTHQLKEYVTPLGLGYSLYYYSVDSANLATAFKGELNGKYSLRIVSNNNEYTATTTIPNFGKRIDSIWWKQAPAPADPDQVIIMARVTDPPGFGNYIRYFTQRQGQPFFSPINSTYDDLFVDGTTYELPVERGVDRNTKIEDEDRFFKRGDTINMKLCSVDKATYDFWRTMEFSYQSVGNPFSTPVKVQSNISGNALGYFGGYAAQYRTLIVPR